MVLANPALAKWGKRALSQTLSRLLGRRNYARFGRFVWMDSRLDVPNDPATNGEHRVQDAFARAVLSRPNVCVFDVGANVGAWTEELLSHLARGRRDMSGCTIHMFEPSELALASALSRARAAAGGARIVPRDRAVSNVSGARTFFVFGDTNGTNTLQPIGSDGEGRRIEIMCTTLDEYCRENGIDHVDFVKVDAEGGDYDVLAGARALLSRKAIDFIQIEYNHRWVAFRHYLKDVFELTEPLGYTVGKITPLGIERYDGWHHELESFREGNYLLWHSELPGTLPTLRWWLEA
jgi:FkbM family methyltransferase